MLEKDWDVLRNYESFELVKKDYQRRHGRSASTQHAREIAAPFAHARSYFLAAREAEQTVRPLLLYYGVVSLSRGLTLMLSSGRREATLAPSHGLSIRSWDAELSKPAPDFGSLRVAVNAAGSFREILDATGHLSLLRPNSSAPSYVYPSGSVGPTSSYALADVVARVPALLDPYRRWMGEPKAAPLAGLDVDSEAGISVYSVSKRAYQVKVTREFCETLFAESACTFLDEDGDKFRYTGTDNAEETPGLVDLVRRDQFGIGEVWLAARYPGAQNLPTIGSLFVLSFMLGMLVRYFPAQWTALIRGLIGDAAVPTITAAVRWIEVEYPRVVVDFLLKKE